MNNDNKPVPKALQVGHKSSEASTRAPSTFLSRVRDSFHIACCKTEFKMTRHHQNLLHNCLFYNYGQPKKNILFIPAVNFGHSNDILGK